MMCSMDQPLPRRREISGDLDSLAASSPGSATAADMRQQQCMAYTRPGDIHLEMDRSSWDEEQDILSYVQSKVQMLKQCTHMDKWVSGSPAVLCIHEATCHLQG